MAFVNLKKKEVQVKVVYYGPGRGGKTTNLEYIYKRFNKRIKTEMVTIKTHGDRTLFFDFLPFDIGKIKATMSKYSSTPCLGKSSMIPPEDWSYEGLMRLFLWPTP